jgi:uncharacterized RDD family membrane protein YckC
MSSYSNQPRRSLDLPLADVSTRFVALIIDGLILGLISAVLSGGGRSAAGGGAGFIIGVIYQWYFLTQQNGQTPGKKIMGIRVVKVNGEKLEAMDAVLRYVGYYINSFVLMIGWLWAFWDADRQGWHDKIAGTVVIRA